MCKNSKSSKHFIYFYDEILGAYMKKIVVFCGSSLGFNPMYKEAAIALGNAFATNTIALVYGGAKIGMMGVLADTILAQKGKVIGVIPTFLKHKEVVHTHVEEMIVCKTMSERKIHMSKLADAYIALPGGFGTLDELFEVLTLGQLHIEQKPIGLLNVNGFFNATLLQLDTMVKEGYLKQKNREMLLVGETVDELFAKMNAYVSPKNSSIIHKVVS